MMHRLCLFSLYRVPLLYDMSVSGLTHSRRMLLEAKFHTMEKKSRGTNGMQLNADQIKAVIETQIENYRKRIAVLSPELVALRNQPIASSRELRQRLLYLEKELVDQQARLTSLKDLQQVIRTLEGLSRGE